jgi:hypothetical protein
MIWFLRRLAALLVVGLHGILFCFVAQRRIEIIIQMPLGASRGRHASQCLHYACGRISCGYGARTPGRPRSQHPAFRSQTVGLGNLRGRRGAVDSGYRGGEPHSGITRGQRESNRLSSLDVFVKWRIIANALSGTQLGLNAVRLAW